MDFNINNYISNLSYINKDFNSIWEEILDVVPKLTNKWRPGEANESDPLVVLLKELGIVSDKINYNTDKNVLELFPDLVTQLRTAYSVFKSMGYNPNWYRSATTEAVIVYNGGVGEKGFSDLGSEKGLPADLELFTEVCDEDATIIYTTLERVKFEAGVVARKAVPIIQGTINDFIINGNSLITADNLDSQNRLYFVQPNVAQNGIFISFDSTFANYSVELGTGDVIANSENTDTAVWKRVDNIYQYLPGSYVYKFGIDPSTGSNYIQFPDDIGTLIGEGIYIKYILSDGANGNIKRNSLTSLLVDPTNTAGTTKDNYNIINLSVTYNGADPESIEDMQRNYERVVGTFNTLVTLRDYENYIYNATNAVGENIVSNIKVSDRTNDLYTHLTYKKMTPSGSIYSESGTIYDNDTTADQSENLKPFNLRLYPLQPVKNVSTRESFNTTFNCTTAAGNPFTKEDQWVKNIINAVANAKAINYDYMENCGIPILIDCTIEGQIYLQKATSALEALEVKSNVDEAIYRNFNARQLYFGEKLNYTKLIDVIKNADPRIQYVALNPVNYTNPNDSNNNTLQEFNKKSPNFDVTVRSILSGATPFLLSEDESSAGMYSFPISWGKEDSKVDLANNVKSINPLITGFVKDTETEADTDIVVQPNETLSIITPEYITKTTYGNYLYVGLDKKEEATKILKNTPYVLNNDLYIYETKNEGEDSIYTISADTTIKFESVDDKIKSLADVDLVGNLYSLGAKNTISVIEKDETLLNNSYLTNNPNAEKSEYGIRVASNSENLFKYLLKESAIGDGYTLNIGEYLLYADGIRSNNNAPVLEVGIIGEGNTIIKTVTDLSLTNKDKDAFLIPYDINQIDTQNTSNDSFLFIDSGNLKYCLNSITSLGEGTVVDFGVDLKDLNISDFNTIQPLNGVTSIKYTPKNATAPITLSGGPYKISYALSLQVGPGLSQTLASNQKVTINKVDWNSGSITSSIPILYPGGGNPLQLTEEETANLVLINTQNAVNDANSDYFQELSDAKAPDVTINGSKPTNSQYFLFACKNTKTGNADRVRFRFIAAGTDVSSASGETAFGPLFLVKDGAKYYDSGAWKKLTNVPSSDTSLDATTTPSLFYAPEGEQSFCPLYFPDDNNIITDPTNANSFFNSNHPCNQYVLPRLNGEGGGDPLSRLTISPLSIKG